MINKKVILDTNLWISFLISKRLNFIDDLLDKSKIQLIFSQELLEEFLTVAKRPKFTKFFNDDKIEDLLRMFDKYGKVVVITSKIEECRDYKDNFLLNLAVDSKANYLVTNDNDLLVIKNIKKTKIIRWKDFSSEFK